MATPLCQIPLRKKGQTTCIEHKGKNLDLYCEKCDTLICLKCLSTSHKGHTVCALSHVTPKKKQEIQNFIEKTEQNDLVQLREYISSTDSLLKDNTSKFDKYSHDLKTQTEQLKHQLDLLTAQTLSRYHKMEEDNIQLIQTYKLDLEMYDRELRKQIKECKAAIQRGSHVEIYDTQSEIQSVIKPVKPVLGAASFTPNKLPHHYLVQALGKIETFDQGQASTNQDGSKRTSGCREQSSTSQQSKPNVREAVTWYKQLPQTKTLTQWRSHVAITSLCPTNDSQVWTSYHYSDSLVLLDRKGNVIQQIPNNHNINDISWSQETQTLWVCDTENKITAFESGRLTHRFSTKKEPKCICVTASNQVILGMTKHISKYSTQGELVLTTSATGIGKPLVCTPYRISGCPKTGNVAVVDWNDVNDGGDGVQHVVVVNSCLKKLFVYKGGIPITHAQSSYVGAEPFNPYGVAYNSLGNIVIGDRNNHQVLLINGHGEFLRIIHTDTKWTMAIGVDKEDVLWAFFGGLGWKNVKLIPTAVSDP